MRDTLLLDLDGTLTDPGPGILGCIRFALERMELEAPPEAELRGWIEPPLLKSFESLTGDGDLAQRCLAHYRERFPSVGYRENAVYSGIPNALKLLRTMAGGCCWRPRSRLSMPSASWNTSIFRVSSMPHTLPSSTAGCPTRLS